MWVKCTSSRSANFGCFPSPKCSKISLKTFLLFKFLHELDFGKILAAILHIVREMQRLWLIFCAHIWLLSCSCSWDVGNQCWWRRRLSRMAARIRCFIYTLNICKTRKSGHQHNQFWMSPLFLHPFPPVIPLPWQTTHWMESSSCIWEDLELLLSLFLAFSAEVQVP